jgi:hypothetical protein
MLSVLSLFESVRARRALAVLAAALAALSSAPLAAQQPFNFGYSAAFGRGRYELEDGSEVQIYRGVIKPRVRKSPGDDDENRRGPGIRVVLPGSVGFLESADNVLTADRPTDRVEAYSFMPGVELEFVPTERFTLRTTVQGGVAKELEGDERSARLGSFGVRGRLKFGDAPARPALIAGLLWAGVDPSEAAEKQSLLRLTAGVEFDIGVPNWEVRGHSMRLLPHVLEERYRRPPPALALGDEPSGDDVPHNQGAETQIGVAAGRDEPFKILFLKFNAVGIAYRFSDRSEGFRLYLNSVF